MDERPIGVDGMMAFAGVVARDVDGALDTPAEAGAFGSDDFHPVHHAQRTADVKSGRKRENHPKRPAINDGAVICVRQCILRAVNESLRVTVRLKSLCCSTDGLDANFTTRSAFVFLFACLVSRANHPNIFHVVFAKHVVAMATWMARAVQGPKYR